MVGCGYLGNLSREQQDLRPYRLLTPSPPTRATKPHLARRSALTRPARRANPKPPCPVDLTQEPIRQIIPRRSNGTGGLHLGSLEAVNNPLELLRWNIKHVYSLMRRGWTWEVNLNAWDLYSTIIPIENKETEDFLTNLDEWVDDLHRNMKLGRNVLVHCRIGVSRSASLVIAYLIKYYGISYKDARQYVASCSPGIKPIPGFVEDLCIFEKICRLRESKLSQCFSFEELCRIVIKELERKGIFVAREERLGLADEKVSDDEREMLAQEEILRSLEKEHGLVLKC